MTVRRLWVHGGVNESHFPVGDPRKAMNDSLERFVRLWRVRPRRAVSRYAIAVLFAGAATLIQWCLRPLLPSPPQALFFYPAVFAVAWLAGLGPGLVATCLSALSIAYLFLPPSFSFAIGSSGDQLDLGIFVALSAILVVSLVRLRQARGIAEEASARLAEERALLEAVIENAPVGLAFATTDGVVRLRNGSLRQLDGQEMASLDNLHEVADRNVLSWKDGRAVSAEQWQSLLSRAREKLVDFEVRWRSPSLSSLWMSGRLAPVPVHTDGEKRLIGTVCVFLDTSAEHRVEELREEFAAVVAHDLRNPIASLSLSLDAALRKRVGTEDVVQVPVAVLERMSRSAQRLDEMVGELLDASRIELSEMRLDRKEVALDDFVREIIDEIRPTLRDHTVVIDSPPLPVTASIDRRRIAQVVTNLLDNASKYSRPRSTIRVALRDAGETAELTVTDEGEGIAAADMPRLFDRFFQAKRARERKAGLGLGLYITKGMVDAHGGRLSVDSIPGVGSVFHVFLPTSARPGGTPGTG
jgi:K+-sensing histidine kinase KdpD